MLRLIYRQRRRIVFTAFFLTLSLATHLARDVSQLVEAGGAGWITYAAIALTMLLVALVAMAGCALLILVAPRWRMVCELVGLIVFFQAAITALWPGWQDVPVLGLALPLALIVATYSLMYGTLLDRFRLWVDHRECRSFRSVKPPEQLWSVLVPQPETSAEHWDPMLYRMDPLDDDEDAFDVRYAHGHSLYEHQTITFLDRDYPHHCRYHHVGEMNPKNRELAEGVYDVRLEPDADGHETTVTICAQRSALLPRMGLLMWFDDSLGSNVDFIRARQAGLRDWSTAGLYRREVTALA